MKRWLCVLLCVILLCISMPLNVLAVPKGNVLIEDDGDDPGENISNAPLLDSNLEALAKDIAKSKNIPFDWKQLSGLMSGAKNLSMCMSLINGSVSLMKLFGVMKDGTSVKLDNIYECVQDIQKTVNEINAKTDAIKNTLTSEFSKADYDFSLSRYDSYQQAWTQFFAEGGSEAKLRSFYDAYRSEFNMAMVNYAEQWQQENSPYGLRALYNDGGEMVLYSHLNMDGIGKPLPKAPTWSDDSQDEVGYSCQVALSATLPGEYIRVEGVFLKADNYTKYLTSAISEGTRKALDDHAVIFEGDDFYGQWEAFSSEEKTKYAEKLAKDFLDALVYDAAFDIVNDMKNGGTFGSQVKTAYDTYCQSVIAANNVTSPVEAGLRRLTLTHGFEGEIKDEAHEICNYFTTLSTQYASFAAMLATMDRSMDSSQKQSIQNNFINTLEAINGYHDSVLTGNDNYCFPLESVVEYHDVSFIGRHSLNFPKRYDEIHQDNVPWYLIDKTVSYPDASDEDAYNAKVAEVSAALETSMFSVRDISLLYYYYLNYVDETDSSDNFMEYLGVNDAMIPVSAKSDTETYGHSTQLIAPGYMKGELKFDGSLTLTAHVEDDVYECLTYEEGQKVKMDKKAFDDGYSYKRYARYYDTIVGDYFDISEAGESAATSITDVTGRVHENAVYTARFYSHPFVEPFDYPADTVVHVRGQTEKLQYMEDWYQHYVFCDGDFTSGAEELKTNPRGPIYSTIEKRMGALVKVKDGTLTIGLNITDLGKNALSSSNLKKLILTNPNMKINVEAFAGVGTPGKRCLLEAENFDIPSLANAWNGGFFGDRTVTLSSGLGDNKTAKCVTAMGVATEEIECPFAGKSGMVFNGWDVATIKDDTTTLIAKWTNHIHTIVREGGKLPTCTASGNTATVKCAECEQVLRDPVYLPTSGHSFTYASIGSSGEAACSVCGERRTFEKAEFGGLCVAVSGSTIDKAVSFSNNVLTVKSDALVVLQNKSTRTALQVSVAIAKDVDANIMLSGVNLIGAPALGIADDSNGKVTITLAENTVNTLQSAGCAAIQKNGLCDGELVINGFGTLIAVSSGTVGSAAIGSGMKDGKGFDTCNITIDNGNIFARTTRGASIGSAAASGGVLPKAVNIVINGGNINANSNGGIGIGGADATGICIRSGTVTAAANDAGGNDGIGTCVNGKCGDVVIYPYASVSATSVNRAVGSGIVYNNKHQIVSVHKIDVAQNLSDPQKNIAVSEISVNGLFLPYLNHMTPDIMGRLKGNGEDALYLFLSDSADKVKVNRGSNNMEASIFGTGSWLIIGGCAAALAVGTVLLLKKKKERSGPAKTTQK